MKIGAAGEKKYACELGCIANKAATAIACNLSAALLSDIHQNWRGLVIFSRCFSIDADMVCRMTRVCFKGACEKPGFAGAAKHFPGDGLDERDQHLPPSINSADCDTWMNTCGKVYGGLIGQGLEAIMRYFAGKSSIEESVQKQGLVLTLSEVSGMDQTCERVSWTMSKGGSEISWYVHERPAVVASVSHPFPLADVPQARTCINAYDAKDETWMLWWRSCAVTAPLRKPIRWMYSVGYPSVIT